MEILTTRRTVSEVLEAPILGPLKLAALGLFVIAAWMLQHPYWGILHDSEIYTLLALARIHPEHLSHDVFLRFGSQDQYTLFSPLYAAAIRHFDLDPAAASLTLACEIALFVGAYLFLRRFLAPPLALLGVGLVGVLSTDYGAYQIFHSTENFITPRLPSEAFVLLGLAAILASRWVLGSVCLLLAMLLHPIIGSAGFALLVCRGVIGPRLKPAVAVAAWGLLISLVVLLVTSKGPFSRFDDAWLKTIRDSSSFLFVSMWRLRDWSRASVPVAIMVCGLITSQNAEVRRLHLAALILAASGLLLTLLYCDLFRVVIVTQAQPWRWLWISTVIAIAFAPSVVVDCWKRGPAFRSVPLVLAAAWMIRGETAALELALIAVACAAFAGRIRNAQAGKLLLLGSVLILAVASVDYVLELSSYHEIMPPAGSEASVVVRWVRERTRDGVPYAALLALLFSLRQRVTTVRGAVVLTGVALLACGSAASVVAPSWAPAHYTASVASRFAQWRRQIPAQAEVMWSENPVDVWYLLDRPSYLSGAQIPGATFSREKALEMNRRLQFTTESLEEGSPIPLPKDATDLDRPNPLYADRATARQLELLCRDTALAFSVSWSDVAPSPFEPVLVDPEKPHSELHIYPCADFRHPVAPDERRTNAWKGEPARFQRVQGANPVTPQKRGPAS